MSILSTSKPEWSVVKKKQVNKKTEFALIFQFHVGIQVLKYLLERSQCCYGVVLLPTQCSSKVILPFVVSDPLFYIAISNFLLSYNLGVRCVLLYCLERQCRAG